MIYRFADYELDSTNYRLARSGRAIALEPKVFDLLDYLVAHRERVATRERLLAALWPGQVVSDSSLSYQVKAARKALEDSGRAQHFIKTIHGRGYQFIAPVSEANTISQNGDWPFPASESPRRRGPSVAILPMQNLGRDGNQDYFSEGISEDIITELARFRDIQVIARHSAFHFKSGATEPGALARELGADYVVEGSVRRSDRQVRLSAHLISTGSGEQVWAERFDFPLQRIFEVQDKIIQVVVATMTGQIRKSEIERVRLGKTDNLNAYEHMLRGMYYHKRFNPTRDDYREALRHFNRALELDAHLARARAMRVCSLSGFLESGNESQNFEHYAEECRLALAQDDQENEAHRILGSCYLHLRKLDLAGFHFRRAIELSPNDANVIAKSARYHLYLDDLPAAEALISRARRLNPLHPGWYWTEIALIRYHEQQYDAAIDAIRRNTDPGVYDLAVTAAICQAGGDRRAASRNVDKARCLDGDVRVSVILAWDAYQNDASKARLVADMIAAGIDP